MSLQPYKDADNVKYILRKCKKKMVKKENGKLHPCITDL